MPVAATYTCPDGTPFPVEWPEAEMADYGWRWDQMHCPVPLTPLAQDFGEILGDGFSRAMDMSGAPARGTRMYANGYFYMRMVPFADDPAVRGAIRKRDLEERLDRILDIFEREYRPEVEALTRSLVMFDSPALTLPEIMARWDQVEVARLRLGVLHMLIMAPISVAGNRFIDFCLHEFGPGGERLASELMAGLPNKSLESAVGLWNLSRVALDHAGVAELLRQVKPAEFLRRVESVPGGAEFIDLFARYLREYGLRAESFTELADPTWQEDPRFPLFLIRRYLDAPDHSSPAMMHNRTAQLREERTAEIEERLAHDPAMLDKFRCWHKSALQRTILLEDHNYYIDQRATVAMRVPCLAAGRELVRFGIVDLAEDVFYLHTVELRQAAADESLRFQPLVVERRAERQRWTRVLPPLGIGSAALSPLDLASERFFGTFSDEPPEPGTLKGVAGSPGLFRGVARKILSLSDIDRLEAGDILVTYATAPPWTPLFAVAGAIVTDAGGTLSHCAVVAREYGIPAVVGCRTATAMIEDGQLITVDGTAGVVRIDG